MIWLDILIGTVTGVISGFGIGGGSLLVLYLTAVAGMDQRTAGGINLLYFIGCAPPALLGHIRQHNLQWQAMLWCSLAGVATAIPVSYLAAAMDTDWLRRLFGVVLLYVGVRELRAGRRDK